MVSESAMKELLFSLAWYDCSNYHRCRSEEILREAFPECDFSLALEEFEKCRTKPPGEGNPR